jgi:hypothetical protein
MRTAKLFPHLAILELLDTYVRLYIEYTASSPRDLLRFGHVTLPAEIPLRILHWHTRPAKHRDAVHRFGISGDRLHYTLFFLDRDGPPTARYFDGLATNGKMTGNRDPPILSGQATSIDVLADAVHMGEMRHAPGPETLKYGLEGSSMRGHLILHPEPRLRRGYAGDKVVSLKLPQLLAKYFGRYPSHGASKFTKSERPAVQALENHWLPTAFYNLNGGVQGTLVTLNIALRCLFHRLSNRTGYFKVPSCGDYRSRFTL